MKIKELVQIMKRINYNDCYLLESSYEKDVAIYEYNIVCEELEKIARKDVSLAKRLWLRYVKKDLPLFISDKNYFIRCKEQKEIIKAKLAVEKKKMNNLKYALDCSASQITFWMDTL